MITTSILDAPVLAPSVEQRTLHIEHGAWAKILGYARLSGNLEINGFGYVSVNEETGNYFIRSADDIFITKQEVSAGSVDVDARVFAKAVYQASQDDRSDDLRLQWHSHVDMTAHFSTTDTTNIASYGPAGMEYFLSLVMNKRGDVSARVDVFQPVRVTAPLRVVVYDNTVSGAELEAEIKEKVTKSKPRVTFVRNAAEPKKPGRSKKPAATTAAPVTTPAPAPVLVPASS